MIWSGATTGPVPVIIAGTIFHGGMLTHLSEQGVRVTLACGSWRNW